MNNPNDIFSPLSIAAAEIVRDTNTVPEIADVRAKLRAISQTLPPETQDPLGLSALRRSLGLPTSTETPVDTVIQELTTWVIEEARDLLNPVLLGIRDLQTPNNIDSAATTLILNGRRVKLPVTYYDHHTLSLAIVLERIGLEQQDRDKLLSKILPSVTKTDGKIVFTNTNGAGMFYFEGNEFNTYPDFGPQISTEAVLAALYAARRSTALTNEEKSQLQEKIIRVSTDSKTGVHKMDIIPNQHTYRASSHGKLRYSAPGGYYDHEVGLGEDAIRQAMRKIGKFPVALFQHTHCDANGTLQIMARNNGGICLEITPDGEISYQENTYHTIPDMAAAIAILEDNEFIQGLDGRNTKRTARKNNLLAHLLNGIELEFEE